MAMSTKTKNQEAVLRKRVQQFYEFMNGQDFAHCHQMIDPRVRSKPSSVTLFQYANALRDFLTAVGPIEIEGIDFVLHLNEPSPLYENRDFAVGETHWKAENGTHNTFSERWVRDGKTWFTRNTGFIIPIGWTATNESKSSERSRVISLD
jgi:hypothetical protein